jgi:hypothetical protein
VTRRIREHAKYALRDIMPALLGLLGSPVGRLLGLLARSPGPWARSRRRPAQPALAGALEAASRRHVA